MWQWCLDATYWCMKWVYGWAGDWGLAIIILTIVLRILIFPISNKQIKSSFQMQLLQPKLKEVQAKYANDPQRMNDETRKIYQEASYNPLSGCLPMLIQMPIFIVVFRVLRDKLEPGSCFYSIISDLTLNPSEVLASSGFGAAMPYLLLAVLFGISTLVPMLLQKNGDKQTKMIAAFMCIFMLWIAWKSPAGVLLYWVFSSIIGVVQQLITQNMMQKQQDLLEAQVVEVKPVKVEVTRKEKKPRPTKKGNTKKR